MRVVREQEGLRIMGSPTFCFSFTSDEFDIYHVADHMRPKGWRFNGQQYPDAIHMAVTRPQTKPGVVEAFEADLVAAVAYAREQSAAGVTAESGAIYGGVPGGLGGLTDDVTEFIEQVHGLDARRPDGPSAPVSAVTRLVLTVDLGSGGPKVGYVTTRGEVVWWWYERADALESVATQDAEEWWRTVVSAARRGQVEGGVDGADVVAVAVTGQWASTVPVDADGRPVAECLMWSDDRGAAYSKAIFGGPVSGYAPRPLAAWLRRTGGIPSPHGCDPVAHMLHLARDRPDVAAVARWYLEPVDYLTMRFTGVAAATHMSMTAAWLTDNRDLGRMEYDDKLVTTAGVDPDRLPPLVRRRVGRRHRAARRGRGARHPGVGAGRHRHARTCRTPSVASGCVRDGAAAPDRSGTTAWISCPVPAKKSDVVRQMASLPGLRRRSGQAGQLPAREQPGQRRPGARVVRGHRGARGVVRRDRSAGGDVADRRGPGALHAVADRRAQPGRRQARARRLPQRVAVDHAGRPGAGGARGRCLQPAVAARGCRALHQDPPGPDAPPRRRRPDGPVVPGGGRRPRPHPRTRRPAVGGRPARRRSVRRPGPRRRDAPTSCAPSCPSTGSSPRTRPRARPTTASPASCRACIAARSGCSPASTADIRTRGWERSHASRSPFGGDSRSTLDRAL